MRMITSVDERSRYIATFRYISVWLMETTASWTPITPEMEAKVMFGRHIWDFAQMADGLGKRTFELRKPMHYSLSPARSYCAIMEQVVAETSTSRRIDALYNGLMPDVLARYGAYVDRTDRILDDPSVVVIERNSRELERQCREAGELTAELGLATGEARAIADGARDIESFLAEESEAA